jgi:hypothetical protein
MLPISMRPYTLLWTTDINWTWTTAVFIFLVSKSATESKTVKNT